ncbi:MAG: virulence factor SrfB [Hyphomicrobiaceae bacterium]|nr:virulence factor SrfB [Hyphomicrobiaceae bacterium]
MQNSERQAEPDSGTDRRFGRANPLFSSVVRLVPRTGLQFIDIEISTRSLAGTLNKFLKDEDPELGSLLIRLPDDARVDGYDLHPVTRRPLTPSDTLWLTGYQALEPFVGTWIPLPYLRFVGRKEANQGRFDKGPTNWARLYIEPPAEGLRKADVMKAVLAFDTEVDGRSRVDQDQYLAPNTDDVFFGPVFMLAPEPEDLDDFLGESWLDDWVGTAFAAFRQRSSETKPDAGAHQLEHLARYITLLKVLGTDAELPQVRFVNTTASHWQTRTFGVDLVIDIDETETAAVIVDRRAGQAGSRLPRIETLRLRDLAEPTCTHDGPFSTTAEFDPPVFGNAVASRRSGRSDAFYWPSLVRIGKEGKRLSQRASATPGLTGLSGVARGLVETEARPGVWRFSRRDVEGSEPGAMVSGQILEHIAEDGTVIGAVGEGGVPAIRPRFSHSSLLSMFLAECLLHSLSQLNAPATLAASGEVRELSRIIVTCPLSATADERRLLLERIEAAVDLVWSARGWGADGTGLAPERPQVSLGIDPGLSSHLAYLYDEVRTRCGGNTRQFMSLSRAKRGSAPSSGADGNDDELRIASLDIASGATSFALVGYRADGEGHIEPRAVIGGRTAIAGASLAEAVLRMEILPAIARSLADAGHPHADGLVERVTSAAPAGGKPVPPHLASRLLAKALNPAAVAFLEIYQELPQGATTAGAGLLALGRLVERGGGRLDHVAAQFEALAATEGAKGFRLADVTVRIRVRAVASALAAQLDPLFERVADVIRSHSVDLLLLSGRHAGLPDVRRLLLKHLPLGPHRVVDVGERWRQMVKDLAPSGPRIGPRMLPLLGAVLGGGRGSQAMDHFGLLADQLADAVPEQTATGLPEPDARSVAIQRLAWAGQGELALLTARSEVRGLAGGARDLARDGGGRL